MEFVQKPQRLKIFGHGKPVLLIHGMGGPEILHPIAEKLAESAKVFLPTLPGFLPQDGIITYSDKLYTDFLKKIMQNNNIQKCDMIGFSMGGRTVINFSIEHGNRLSKVIGIDSAGYTNFSPLFTLPLLKRIAPRLIDSLLSNPKNVKKFALQDLVNHKTETARRVVNLFSDMIANATVRKNFANILALIGRKNRLWDNLLPTVSLPYLLLWAAEDKTCPVRNAMEIQALLPNASLHIQPGYRHLGLLEAPDFYLEKIVEFLEL